MRELTNEEIEAILKKYPKARRTPVFNFLSSMGTHAQAAHINFGSDAASYRWDSHIQKAIRLGMQVANGHAKIKVS